MIIHPVELQDHLKPSGCKHYTKKMTQNIHTNFDVTDSNDNWLQLAFLEAFYIKNFNSSTNEGIKASKEW